MQILDGKDCVRVSNGVEMMTKITAAGCSVTAVAAAFLSLAPKSKAARMRAAAFALGIFGCAPLSQAAQPFQKRILTPSWHAFAVHTAVHPLLGIALLKLETPAAATEVLCASHFEV